MTQANPPKVAPPIFSGKQWQQVLTRDARADGQFVYAVKSTGIYCRPSCPSRRPERKQVSFYPTPALAEEAGFRACLRCEPQRSEPKDDPEAKTVAAAVAYFAEHAGERTPLEDVAKAIGTTRIGLLRGFKRVLGVTPSEYNRAQRRERFATVVRNPKTRVTDDIYTAGYGSPSRLHEEDALGMTPSVMKAGGAGEKIRFTFAAAPQALGTLLVAATKRGICAVLFVESPEAGEADLRKRFPKAELIRDRAHLGKEVATVLAALSDVKSANAVPLDVLATAFQQRVWSALRAIPRGETRTYAQIAEHLGAPTATRAVATACGANPIALAIPCHRVIGANGALTGYRWGVERKRKLLELERQ